MRNFFKISVLFISLTICPFRSVLTGQILYDTTSLNLIKKGIDSIYNMQFGYAGEVYRKINQLYPGHPLVMLFKGTMAFWENYPLRPGLPASSSFEKEMSDCIRLCDKPNKKSSDAEYLLANLCSRGLLMSYYANNDLHDKVFPLARTTYKYIRRSFYYTSVSSDFFFFTGLYNYYREVYPKVYPVYMPLAILFPKGNKEKGLIEIQKASQNSIFLKEESYSDLAYVYIAYENNYKQATYFNKYLHEHYPANPEYTAEYIKNLLLLKDYDEAEKLINNSSSDDNNSFLDAQISIFKGLIQEKKYSDKKTAQEYFIKGVKEISLFGDYGNEFAAYAYFGLSRISGSSGDKENKRIYRKQAQKLAVGKGIDFD